MAVGEAVVVTAPRAPAVRAAVWCYAIVVALAAAGLWWMQLIAMAQPCEVPGCVWPQLSDAGFGSLLALGVPPTMWVVFASIASIVWWLVPFSLGLVTAGSRDASPMLAVLWFTFSLGTLSSVPSDPLILAVMRTVTLGAWFTVFAIYPTGRFAPRWVTAAPVVAVCWTIVLSTPAVRAAESANDPLWWTLEAAVYVACVALILVSQVVRFRHGDDEQRRQISLLLVAFAPFLALGLAGVATNVRLDADALGYGSLGGALMYEASSFLTVVLIGSVGTAMLRHGAFGVRVAVDRVLVGTIALALAATVYAATVLLSSIIAPSGISQALAAVVTAVVLASTYSRLARGIGRLVYGDADDPSAVAAALAQRVAEASAPEDLGPRIAAELADRLRFPGVVIRAAESPLVRGEAGRPDGRRASVSLLLDGEVVGEADVALRPGQARLSSRDRTALAAAAGPLATAVTAFRLSEEVRRSRFEIVAGRDEERRMLRRTLHDEVGPTLALAGHRIAAARDDASQLAAAAATIDDAVSQIRAISRELRPPALDEWGLQSALESFARGLDLPTTIAAPDRLSPAVVEVAVYRITVEALLNAARHARATRATVTVRTDHGAVVVDIDDDGTGMDEHAPAGVGTLSMRERATELGGSLTFARSTGGGLRVHAELPLGSEPES